MHALAHSLVSPLRTSLLTSPFCCTECTQASYYYMGHFSKYLPRGSIRVDITNTVIEEKVLTAEDVKNSQPLVFMPCDGSELQSWTLDQTGSIFVEKTQYECIDVSNYGAGPRLDTYSCAHSPNQMWERRISPTCTDEQVAAAGVACSQLVNTPTGKCLTKVTVSGAAIGLDAGTKYTVGQALPCKEIGDPSQVRACVALACLHASSDPFPSLSLSQSHRPLTSCVATWAASPIRSPSSPLPSIMTAIRATTGSYAYSHTYAWSPLSTRLLSSRRKEVYPSLR